MHPILQDWTPPARPAQTRPPGAALTRLRLVGSITVENAIELFAAIRSARDNSIEIEIDSTGGSALGALGIFESLLLHPRRVTADIERASSGAVLVALGADHRRVAPGARIMLHETRADLRDATADVLRSTLADIELFDGIATGIIASATGQPPERVAAWRRATTTFNAHQAVNAGLAKEIS